jgi:hypothetical protein
MQDACKITLRQAQGDNLAVGVRAKSRTGLVVTTAVVSFAFILALPGGCHPELAEGSSGTMLIPDTKLFQTIIHLKSTTYSSNQYRIEKISVTEDQFQNCIFATN